MSRLRLILPPIFEHKSLPKVIEKEDFEITEAQLKEYNKMGYNIYYFPNGNSKPISHNLNARDVDKWEWVFVDMDLKDEIYKTKLQFLDVVHNFPVAPTKTIDSGHGCHVLWEISDLTRDKYLEIQKALISKFKTDSSIWTITQLMRMEGYWNTKADPWVMAKVTREKELNTGNSYTCEQLLEHLDPISDKDKRDITTHVNKYIHGIELKVEQLTTEPLPERFLEMMKRRPQLDEYFHNPKDRSKADIKIANILQIGGFTREETSNILLQTSKGQERGISYVAPIVDKVYDNPLDSLSSEYEDLYTIADPARLLEEMKMENYEYKLKQENIRVKAAKELDKKQGTFSFKNTQEIRKKIYKETNLKNDICLKDTLPCITERLTKVIPLYGVNSVLIAAESGQGKCFRLGTKIRMFDGSVKNVEDVKVGDQVMGPDSKPRNVLSLGRGREEMFDIIPVKGEKYTVNKSHILALKHCDSKTIAKGTRFRNLSVEDYIKSYSIQKNPPLKGYRVGVEYSEKNTSIDPYFLGTWLGDGTSTSISITTMEPEVVECWNNIANLESLSTGLPIRLHKVADKGKASTYNIAIPKHLKSNNKSSIKEKFNLYNLMGNKHIPNDFLLNSRKNRLELLAGIIDTDGYLGSNGYDLCFKHKLLAEQTVELVRSLGLAAYLHECQKHCTNSKNNPNHLGTYYRISISGNTDMIPCRVPRRKASPRKQIKDVLSTGIKVVPVGVDDYYGFAVDGDHLFLLADFTVVHNSSIAGNICLPILNQGKRILYISTEERATDIMNRIVALRRGWNINARRTWTDNMRQARDADIDKLVDDNQLVLVDNYTPNADETVFLDCTTKEGFKTALHTMEKENEKFDLLVVDYISKINSSSKSSELQEYLVLEEVIRYIEEWGKRNSVPSVVFTQLKPSVAESTQFEQRLVASKRILRYVTMAIEIKTDYENKLSTWICRKNRDEGVMFRKTLRYDKGRFIDCPQPEDSVEDTGESA